MTGIVYKILADKFWVLAKEGKYICTARGNLKSDGIFVGDHVKISNLSTDEGIIEEVEKRKNQFIRPPLANLDCLIITIAQIPEPDFMIVDKLILFSLAYGVQPYLVVNKIDIDNGICRYVEDAYKNVVEHICYTNAKTGEGVDELKQIMRGKLCAFAGQSAVGKSALVNKIMQSDSSETGEISIKNQKGKNTTRHCQIFFSDDIMVTDTAGFTSLDEKLLPISYFELPYFYPDFVEYHKDCKYKSCAHFNEKKEDCAVKRAVLDGLIDKSRFLRYKEIYKILNEKWVKTHG